MRKYEYLVKKKKQKLSHKPLIEEPEDFEDYEETIMTKEVVNGFGGGGQGRGRGNNGGGRDNNGGNREGDNSF